MAQVSLVGYSPHLLPSYLARILIVLGLLFFYNDNDSSLPQPAEMVGFSVVPIEFDKDIDAQMRVVAAVSNLRARNYRYGKSYFYTLIVVAPALRWCYIYRFPASK